MNFDSDSATLLNAITLTGGTLTSAYQGDNMKGYCVSAVVSSGAFTTGCYAWLQGSIDGTNYAHISSSTLTVNAIGTYIWNVDSPYYNFVQCGFTIPSGNVAVEVKIRSHGWR